ncbi:MAG TPA: class I SAM-dependent methyltransferase [Flavobacteriaceae bacterium]|nr:class I SAM-dependent methyltransferase [Flavobacteriaceae bacterium]
MQKDEKPWYASWFDTPFYHILYQDRDEKEAALLINHLLTHLELSPPAKILDLACGKGRHSRYLNHLGYDVVGLDLSQQSIDYAKQYENDSLHFEVHDKLIPYPKKFDAVFNLFTSFGYFEDPKDNIRVIENIKSSLKPNGYGVIDFMNAYKEQGSLVAEEVKTVDGITFLLNRYLKDGVIFKDIRFEFAGESYHFTERVSALQLEDFKAYFDKAGVTLVDVFGDFKLAPFDRETSKRLMLIFK